MARRRRSKGTWFPTLGADSGSVDFEIKVTGIDDSITVDANGNVQTEIHSLTHDEPSEEENPDNTLADIIGSEYLLRRVVGKFHAVAVGDETSPLFVLLAAGLFVARAEHSDASVPIGVEAATFNSGAATGHENAQSYSPLVEATMREPWIWRRTWILGNSGSETLLSTAARAWEMFPPSTALFGSVADGPHVDAKTLRRVGQDDRLFLAVSGVRWPISTTPDPQIGDTLIPYHFDYRIFGALRKARGSGKF